VFSDSLNHCVRRITRNRDLKPILAEVSNLSMLENEALTVNFSVVDLTIGSASFTLTDKPGFGTFTDNGNGTAKLELKPGFDDAFVYRMTIGVTQGGRTENRNFAVTVVNNNRLPSLKTTIGNQNIINGQVKEIPLVAEDEDVEPIDLKLTNAPSFISIQYDEFDRKGVQKARLRIAPTLFGVTLPAVYENITITPEDIEKGVGAPVKFNLLVTASVISSFPIINVSAASFL